MYKCKSPVAIVIFKRIKNVEGLIERIKPVSPDKIYVISDGGRNDEEWEQVQECRRLVESAFPQESVTKIYSDKNLGCDTRIITGLNELFENEEKAIILEDDCMPNESFFRFCDEMLEEYKDNDEISHIVGGSIVNFKTTDSYFFSYMGVTWGWATFKRAWATFKRAEDRIKDGEIEEFYTTTRALKGKNYQESLKEQINWYVENKGEVPWDYSWFLTNHGNKKLCIVPNKNLILNIGFDSDGATHTDEKPEYYKGVVQEEMEFPLKKPSEIKDEPSYGLELHRMMNYKDPLRFFKPSYYIKRLKRNK